MYGVLYLYSYGWDWAGWPMLFATEAEAKAEIREHVKSCRAAGLRDYRVRDYRVTVVPEGWTPDL